MTFGNAEKSDCSCPEQTIDGSLHVDSHMAGKLPRARDQLVARNTDEVPFQRFVGILELLFAGDLAEVFGDAQRAFVADHDRFAADAEFVFAGEIPAHPAGSRSDILTGLTRHRQRMPGCKDPLSGVPKQGFGDLPRIRAAHGLALVFGDCDDSDGVLPRLVEDQPYKVDHEIYRSEVVAVKNELKVIGLGVNILHRNSPWKR